MNMTLNKVAVLKLASVAFLALAIILVFFGMFSIQEPPPNSPKLHRHYTVFGPSMNLRIMER